MASLLLQAVLLGLAAGLVGVLRVLDPTGPTQPMRHRWPAWLHGSIGAVVTGGWLSMMLVVTGLALGESAPAALGAAAVGAFGLVGSLELLHRTAIPGPGPRVPLLTAGLAGLLGIGSVLFTITSWLGWVPADRFLALSMVAVFPLLATAVVVQIIRDDADWPSSGRAQPSRR